jgi:hypothetical protein
MGLDAHVNCRCFETAKLRELPPREWDIYVAADGGVDCRNTDLETLMAFDAWTNQCRMCEHEDGVALHHYIGNVGCVAFLREELGREPESFPLLLKKVVYNGVHAGDWHTCEEVRALLPELDRLRRFSASDAKDQPFVESFRNQMTELVECALSLNKPIVF